MTSRFEKHFPYGRHSVDESDVAAVAEVLRSDYLATGPKVEAFEQALAARVGAKEAAACANGTAALHLAALALGLQPGDHAIVPAITFLATANAVRLAGAEVIFADIDPGTGLMMPEHVERALTGAHDKKVRAVFPVHLNGQTGDPAAMKRLAQRHGLHVVDDACHALGASYVVDNREYPVGSCAHADLTVFSFHPVKAIAAGEGGMVTGADAALIARVKSLRNHGMIRDPEKFADATLAFDGGKPNPWYYEMQELGLNYRLSDIHCALGLSQLSRLDQMLARRSELVDCYRDALRDRVPQAKPIAQTSNCSPGWHLFVVLIDFEAAGRTRAEVMRALAEAGIGTQVHYIPVYRQPYYQRRYGQMRLSGAEQYYSSCLSLPLFATMTDRDVIRIVGCLAEALE